MCQGKWRINMSITVNKLKLFMTLQRSSKDPPESPSARYYFHINNNTKCPLGIILKWLVWLWWWWWEVLDFVYRLQQPECIPSCLLYVYSIIWLFNYTKSNIICCVYDCFHDKADLVARGHTSVTSTDAPMGHMRGTSDIYGHLL